jgi:TonB family protein
MTSRIGLCFMLLLSPLSLFAGKPKADQPFYECSYEHPASAGTCATSPVAIHTVLPEYSEEARQAQLAGEVVVALVVGKKGVPSDVHVVKSLGKGLDERAIAAVEQWRFTPGTYKGHAVAVSVTLPLDFQHCDTPGAYQLFPAPGSDFSIAEAEPGK